MLATNIRVGAILPNLLCPDYDKGAFGQCIAPLYPDAWNVWEIVYNGEWSGDTSDVLRRVGAWLNANNVKFDHLQLRAQLPDTPISTHAGVCAGNSQSRVQMTLRGKPGSVTVQFVARTGQTGPAAIPWLAYRSAPEGALKPPGFDDIVDTRCPVGADVLLRTVWEPPDEQVPEPPKGILDKLEDKGTAAATNIALTYTLYLAAFGALGYGLYRLSRR